MSSYLVIGVMPKVHRGSPSRSPPSTLKIIAILDVQPKSLDVQPKSLPYLVSSPNHYQGCRDTQTSPKQPPSTSECPFFTSWGLAWLSQYVPSCIQDFPDSSHPATLPQLPRFTASPSRGCQHDLQNSTPPAAPQNSANSQVCGQPETTISHGSKWFAKQKNVPYPFNLSLCG